MAIKIPFLLYGSVALSANAAGRITLIVSANETVEIHEIFHKSTGNFNITGISDSRGNQYTNAGTGSGIDNDFIQDAPTSNNAMSKLIEPMLLPGGTSLYIDLLDTSGGANTVEVFMNCRKTIGQ